MRIDQLLWLLSIQPWITCTLLSTIDEYHCNISPCYSQNFECQNNGSRLACPAYGVLLNSDEFKDHIENFFNNLRNNVAGGHDYKKPLPAARICAMSWREDLAQLAKLDVMRCTILPRPWICSMRYRIIGRLADIHAIYERNITATVMTILNSWAASVGHLSQFQVFHMPNRREVRDQIQRSALLLIDYNKYFGCAALRYTRTISKLLIFSCIFGAATEEGMSLYTSSSKPGAGCKDRDSKYQNLCAKGEKYSEKYGGGSNKKNPGNVQTLHSLAHNVMPKFYDGVELNYYHRLAPNKFISAAWVLSHVRASGFRFGGLYTFRVCDDFMLTPTIVGDIHPTTLAANLNILYYPFKPLRLEAVLQKPGEDAPVETQYTVEYTRPSDTWTANFYNVRNENGRCTLSVMRSITQHWAIGGELLLEWNEPKNLMSDLAFAARYSHHNYSFAATASRLGLDVSYWQRIHPQIQMANLLAWNRNTRKTIATICYQWNFWNCAVHGMIDSDALVGFMWTKYLSNLPLQMGFSVVMSLPTDRFAFGMRFVLDPSGLRRGD